MNKIQLKIAIIIGMLSVIIGAFGAHAFKPFLTANQHIDTFETAAKYQIYGAFSIIIAILLNEKLNNKWLTYATNCFIIGTIIFSGSLYLICITNQKFYGAIAPIGGTGLVLAWLFLLIGVSRKA